MVEAVFTSLRYDRALRDVAQNGNSAFCLLPYHWERLREAACKFGWPSELSNDDSYAGFVAAIEQKMLENDVSIGSGPLKVSLRLQMSNKS